MVNFTTPNGRVVQGDCYVAQPQKETSGKPKLDKHGQPAMQFYIGLAIDKNDPALPAFLALLSGEARKAWPQYHDAATGKCTNPTFANKIIDGDGVDEKGQRYDRKEGFKGHLIVKLASSFAPKVVAWDPSFGAWAEFSKVKRGDYVSVAGSTSSNQSTVSPGMYMNLDKVAFEREGAAIVSGVSAEEAFGKRGPASAAPAPSYTGYMGSPPAPPAPLGGPVMLAAANGVTYEAYIAGGWTDAQMRAAGMLS